MRYCPLPNLRNLWYLFVVLYVSKDWIYICLQLNMSLPECPSAAKPNPLCIDNNMSRSPSWSFSNMLPWQWNLLRAIQAPSGYIEGFYIAEIPLGAWLRLQILFGNWCQSTPSDVVYIYFTAEKWALFRCLSWAVRFSYHLDAHHHFCSPTAPLCYLMAIITDRHYQTWYPTFKTSAQFLASSQQTQSRRNFQAPKLMTGNVCLLPGPFSGSWVLSGHMWKWFRACTPQRKQVWKFTI